MKTHRKRPSQHIVFVDSKTGTATEFITVNNPHEVRAIVHAYNRTPGFDIAVVWPKCAASPQGLTRFVEGGAQ